MKHLRFLILIILFAGLLQPAMAQNISNEGTEFWTVFPTHDQSGTSAATMNVNVTSRFTSEVTVSCNGWTSMPTTIPANTVVTFLVPRPNSYISPIEANIPQVNRGIHIVVTPGKPKVVAYSHVFAGFRSAATLILPYDALGQRYYSMNYTQDLGDGSSLGFLTIVAADDNTNLIIHKKDGTTLPLSLNKGDVYEYMPSVREDLTGTFVEVDPSIPASSCRRFAAFSGSTSIRIGCPNSRDPLFQQLYSLNSWGKTYGVVPFINRQYIIRVLAQENNTTVNIDGVLMGVIINKGDYLERTLVNPVVVSADKSISVAQYSLTQNCSSANGTAMIGDPEMVLLNPTEFNIKNITLFSSNNNSISEKYINVFMKTDKTSSFKLNGSLPNNGVWQPMPSDPNYSYIQIQVFDESLTLIANDGFNAIAYGFGQTESYAYSAGTSLASNQFITLLNKVTNVENSAACVGQVSDFKMTLPFEVKKLEWDYDADGNPDDIVNDPPYTKTGTNPALYTYTSPVSKIFTTVAKGIQITAIATLAQTAGSCYSNIENLVFEFDVDPLPEAKIEASATACANNEVQFTDKSDSKVVGKNITAWQWDFGDPASGALNTSTLEKPLPHIYTTPGSYTVKLSVTGENGCYSNIVTHDIFINPKPKAEFTVSTNFCVNRNLVITNLSSISAGSITNYLWDFGDGIAPIPTSSNTPPVFKYTTAGLKTIKLTVTSDNGCFDVFTVENIKIVALPNVNFETPGYCVDDGLAKFKNLTKDYDGTTTNLTFEWNFGDGTPSVGPSANYDGEHTYTTPGRYDVTLKVYNQFGCEADVKVIPFIVNPFVTAADFTIQNEANLCSGNDVIINNTSTISNPGTILKIEVYKDFINNPTSFETILNPLSEDIILSYPKFGGNADKTYSIKLKAYSGETCVKEITKTITIKPSPILEFSVIPSVCRNEANDVYVNLASETSGIIGNGIYSGNGIVDEVAGKFNPRSAGLGVHSITYTFTAGNGCPAQITQTIEVFKEPSVDAGNDFYILAGGEKEISATATGVGLSYEWTPAAGLSRTDILNPIAKPDVDTKYTVKVTSSQGCYSFDEIYVHVLQSVETTNTFSPNGDGVNDVWNVKYLDTYPNSTVEIFDRNGQRVYLSNRGYANPFDGNYKGKALPVGTYYYIINPNSGRKNITGNLTIIR